MKALPGLDGRMVRFNVMPSKLSIPAQALVRLLHAQYRKSNLLCHTMAYLYILIVLVSFVDESVWGEDYGN